MTEAPGQYFDPTPVVASRPGDVALHLPDLSLRLATDRGVFAAGGVDPGTKLLLLEGPPPAGAALAPGVNLVDVGCGYGPIALSLAVRAPAATVWAVDVNERARALCAANARANGLGNVVVVSPADVPDGLEVAGIWSNPPIRIGKAALHDLLAGWLARLAPADVDGAVAGDGDGHPPAVEAAGTRPDGPGGPGPDGPDGPGAWLVVQRHLGADSLAAWLGASGWPTTRLRSRQSFRLLEVRRGAAPPS